LAGNALTMAAFTDHLWQSLLCLLVATVFAALLCNAGARVRLWILRITALKFLLPFALLQALGGWLGFPVMHPSEPAPPSLVSLVAGLRPLLAPAQNHQWHGTPAMAVFGLLLVVSIGWLFWISRQLRIEGALAEWQARHAQDELQPQAVPVGFFRAAMITLILICAVSAPMIAGAVEDRQQRHALILANSQALREASFILKVAAPGLGGRYRLVVDAHGVRVRNANVQELIAIGFGVSPSAVMGDQVTSRDTRNPYDYWMISPRYDLQVTGPVLEPERFDSYSLHLLITRLMAEKFGIEIQVNGTCQSPCGRWDKWTPPSH
jgi:hypothetical protein